MSSLWCSLFLTLVVVFFCAADLKKYNTPNITTCSQGLKKCTLIHQNSLVPQHDLGPVKVLSFNVESALCCKAEALCKPCLRIEIQLRILAADVSGETPEIFDDEDQAAVITLCYVSVPNHESCYSINFNVTPNSQKNEEKTEMVVVVVHDGMFLGSSVNVTVNRMSQIVQFRDRNSVCPSADIEECQTPRIFPVIDGETAVVKLRAEPEDPLHICMRRKGMALCWPSDWTIPLHAVTHCMCFQAWKETEYDKSSRSEICPFETDREFRRNTVKNMSLFVGHRETNEGRSVLSWNISAPCRLEAEVWPCQAAVSLGERCREVPGFRRNISTEWKENTSMVWTSDEFLDVRTTNNLHPCVMFKVDGETFGPVCERDTRRGRWIWLVFGMVLLGVILLAVGLFVFRSRHQEWLSNSNTTHPSQDRRGEVLLVYSAGSNPSLSDTACWFAKCLSELGFSVSLDLWSKAAVSALGPTPWLHSRLQHIQNQGGKILLLLSQDAVLRAEACYESWSSVLKRDGGKVNMSWPSNSDVFGSALISLFSAHLQGSATKHFALVHLGSEALDLPELFQGLKLYQLPSESHRLLAHLHTGHPQSLGARLKRFLWAWRASARLRNYEKEYRLHTLSMHMQVDSLSMGKEMKEETLPLHIYNV